MLGARPLASPGDGSTSLWALRICIATLTVLGVLLAAGLGRAPEARSATLPSGFSESVAFSGLNHPMVIRFAPDGRIFIAEKSGVIKVYSGLGDTTPTVFANLGSQIQDWWDRGLLSIALDPAFPTRPYVYVLYTYDSGGWGDGCPTPPGPNEDGCVVHGRLSRLQAQGDVMTGSEQVLIQDWCQQYPSHSVGDLAFGPDGALYVSAGDGASFSFVDYGQRGSPPNPCGDPPVAVGGTQTPPSAEGGALRSQDLRTRTDPVGLSGAILRVDPNTGAGMAGNPMASDPDANARRIIAYGLRNPFRFAFRPGTSELWIGDVGWNDWEEIDRIVNPTDATVENFGWPCYEGNARQVGYDSANLSICEGLYGQPAAHTGPYFAYHHTAKVVPNESCPTGGSSVAGTAFQFYSGGPYPAEYDGALFFADYSRDCVWAMAKGGDNLPAPGLLKTFVAAAGNPVDLELSPAGELYYADFDGGTIRRIQYGAGPPNPEPPGEEKAAGRPTAASSEYSAAHSSAMAVDRVATTRWSSAFADNQWWQVDLGSARNVDAVRLDWEAAYATRYQILTSLDGTNFTLASEQTASSSGPQNTTFPLRSARYVRVLGLTRATQWGFSFWEARVYGPPESGNAPPVPTISAPAAGTTWQVGQSVAFSGSATDAQDGSLPASALTWSLVLNHCPSTCHTHPLQDYVGVSSGTFNAPDHDYPSHLELRLTARDSAGATTTVTRRLDPKTVSLHFASVPSGLSLVVGSSASVTPFDRTVILGSSNSISATSPQTLSGQSYAFSSWSDGGAQTHNIVASAGMTYTATYASTSTSPPANTGLPTISGMPREGDPLTASPGTWAGAPSGFAYQWLRCTSTAPTSCTTIGGATVATYVPTSADVGRRLRVRVTATNSGGSTAATSNASQVVKRRH